MCFVPRAVYFCFLADTMNVRNSYFSGHQKHRFLTNGTPLGCLQLSLYNFKNSPNQTQIVFCLSLIRTATSETVSTSHYVIIKLQVTLFIVAMSVSSAFPVV